MCQMRIILKNGDHEELVLENASLLEATDDGVVVSALLEQPKLIRGAAVSGIDFLHGRVTLTETRRKARDGTQDSDR